MIDRHTGPEITLPTELNMPGAVRYKLNNNLSLYVIEAGTQEVIRLSIVIKAGTRHQNAPFVASSLLNMLSEGSKKYTSVEIAEKLDLYGIYYDTSIDRDYGILTVSCLEKFLDQTLDLLSEILLYPALSADELSTYCTKRKEQLTIEREKPSYIARELFSVALFGAEHPYGKVSGVECYDTLIKSPELLREFYNSFYISSKIFAVTSGRISASSLTKIKAFLTTIPAVHGSSAVGNDEFLAPPIRWVERVVQPRDGAVQSSIRIGKRLFSKDHPDFNEMQVVAMILGGYFGSRLVNNLREDKGYTYGIYSAMMNLEHDGYIAIATDVAAEHTDDAITQIFNEIQTIRDELVPEAELDMVRNIIVGEMMRIIDGPFGVADIMIEGVQNNCHDNSYLEVFLRQVQQITPERIRELAIQYLEPDSFTSIIVG